MVVTILFFSYKIECAFFKLVLPLIPDSNVLLLLEIMGVLPVENCALTLSAHVMMSATVGMFFVSYFSPLVLWYLLISLYIRLVQK